MAFTLTPKEKVTIKSILTEVSNSFTRMEAERDNVRECINRLKDEFNFNKRMARKLARGFHKNNIEEENATQAEISEIYDAVVK
jgi:hypothetical protein